MSAYLGAYILFGFVVLALIVLILIAVFAKKYLKGDYIKNKEEEVEEADQPLLEDDSVYEEKEFQPQQEKTPAIIIEKYKKKQRESNKSVTLSLIDRNRTSTAIFLLTVESFNSNTSPDSSVYEIDSSGSFAGDASIWLMLKYIESTNCIIGNIKTIQGLNAAATNCPKDISFHLKLLPKGKFRMKTPWRPSTSSSLSLTFTIGPVKTAQILKCLLCIRLYGRLTSSKFARPICHGECTVKLSNLLGVEDGLEIEKHFLPKNQFASTEDLRFTTDSESEI